MVATARTHIADRLSRDEPAFGVNVLSGSPAVVEALAGSGFDYVWVDLEHAGPSPYDADAVAGLARAAALADLELLVRVPAADRTMINKVVDAGADTVLVPKVETAAAAGRAVRAARFEHDGGPGDRGAPLTRSSGWVSADDGLAERADGSVTVGVMLETADAAAAAGEILSVPDVAFGFVGPGDLSISLGHPLETSHPAVEEAVASIRDAAADCGVPLGRIATEPDDAAAAVDAGYRVIRLGVDTVAVAETMTDRLSAVRERL
jgi:2-dehydro-3-deoxyglucarate aldolase